MTYEEHQLKQWQIQPPTDDLADRIFRHAIALPQQLPLGLRMERAIERFFTQWQYALAYKTAAFASLLMLGFWAGTQQTSIATTTTNTQAAQTEITDMAMASGDWIEQF